MGSEKVMKMTVANVSTRCSARSCTHQKKEYFYIVNNNLIRRTSIFTIELLILLPYLHNQYKKSEDSVIRTVLYSFLVNYISGSLGWLYHDCRSNLSTP